MALLHKCFFNTYFAIKKKLYIMINYSFENKSGTVSRETVYTEDL